MSLSKILLNKGGPKLDIILNYLTSFLINKETYDIGSILYIQENIKNYPILVIDGIHHMITKVSDNLNKKRNRETVNLDALVIIIIESILTNYHSAELDKRPENKENFNEFMLKFSSNEFFNNCKEMIKSNPSDTKTGLQYMSYLLNEIELIYKKEKNYREFEYLSQNAISLKELRLLLLNSSNFKVLSSEIIQKELFSKIFTKDINTIITLLAYQNNSIEIQFSLIRIYLTFFEKSKNWSVYDPNPLPMKIDGKTMIYNLFRCYVNSFEGNKDNLFKEDNSDNPLFCFIVNYMQVLFLPIYYEFTMNFDNFFITPGIQRKEIDPIAEDFFNNKALSNELLTFFENLPSNFKNFFCILHELIKIVKSPTDNAPASAALRGLLINRFLFNPILKMMADPDIARNSSYVMFANYFKDLFYAKNLSGKFSNIPQFAHLCISYVKVFDQITTDFQGGFTNTGFQTTNSMLRFDYERIYRVFNDIRIMKSEFKPLAYNYSFTEYTDPHLIKNIRVFQEDLKHLRTPTNMNSAQLKPAIRLINEHATSATLNNDNNTLLYADKTPPNNPSATLPLPQIPLTENTVETMPINAKNAIDIEEFENEMKKKVDLAIEIEREAQKNAFEKLMEVKFNEWEQTHRTQEIQENIKNKDALLNEMYEKINIEEQKFQMLMKIQELDDENSGLKMFLETCPPFYNHYGKGLENDDIENGGDVDEIIAPEEKLRVEEERREREEKEKKLKEDEFYQLCLQSQEILTSMAIEDNECSKEIILNPELWVLPLA